jgi:D-lactate dehydrogenase
MEHILLNKENVLVTPHNAFNTKEAVQEILDVSIADVKSFLSNTPENVVKPE